MNPEDVKVGSQQQQQGSVISLSGIPTPIALQKPILHHLHAPINCACSTNSQLCQIRAASFKSHFCVEWCNKFPPRRWTIVWSPVQGLLGTSLMFLISGDADSTSRFHRRSIFVQTKFHTCSWLVHSGIWALSENQGGSCGCFCLSLSPFFCFRFSRNDPLWLLEDTNWKKETFLSLVHCEHFSLPTLVGPVRWPTLQEIA